MASIAFKIKLVKKKEVARIVLLAAAGFWLLVGCEYWLIKTLSQRIRQEPPSVDQFYQLESYTADDATYLNTILVNFDLENQEIIIADQQGQASHLLTPATKLAVARRSGLQEISLEKLRPLLKPRAPISVSFAPNQPTELLSLTIFQL